MKLLAVMIATLAATAAPAARPAPDAQLAKLLAGRVAGAPVRCISLPQVRSSEVIDGQAIVYKAGATFYVNRPAIGAEALDDDDILVTRTPSSMLCNLDTINLVNRASGFPNGFVGLGEFVPYRRAPR